MVLTALVAAFLQYGSCQSGGPDDSRTAPEAAQAFVEGVASREDGPIRWVTRPGTVWQFDTGTMTDAQYYARMAPREYPNRRPVVTGMAGTSNQIAVVTRIRGVPGSDLLTVLTVEGGCITAVRVFGRLEDES